MDNEVQYTGSARSLALTLNFKHVLGIKLILVFEISNFSSLAIPVYSSNSMGAFLFTMAEKKADAFLKYFKQSRKSTKRIDI